MLIEQHVRSGQLDHQRDVAEGDLIDDEHFRCRCDRFSADQR
jgi:hypothetical protein